MRIVLVGIILILGAQPVIGHELTYVGAADQLRDPSVGVGYADYECMATENFVVARARSEPLLEPLLVGVGGVCYEAGHVQPISDHGSTTLVAFDLLINAVSAFYCQDNNDDGLCGGDGDYGQTFCGSIYLHSEPDDDPPEPPNWDLDLAVAVYVDGPLNGSPLYTACAGDPPKAGTFGTVWHP